MNEGSSYQFPDKNISFSYGDMCKICGKSRKKAVKGKIKKKYLHVSWKMYKFATVT